MPRGGDESPIPVSCSTPPPLSAASSASCTTPVPLCASSSSSMASCSLPPPLCAVSSSSMASCSTPPPPPSAASSSSQEIQKGEDIVLLLHCRHHPALPPAVFPVFKGVNPRKRPFALMSDSQQSKFTVGQVCILGKNILLHKNFDRTVARWLLLKRENGGSVYDSFYSCSPRPAEFTMNLVRAMVDEVFKLHDEGKFHGNLKSLEVFGYSVSCPRRWIGEMPVRVTLLPSPGDFDFDNDFEKAICCDGRMLKEAFDQIFCDGDKIYPPYLMDWATLFDSPNWSKNKWLISNHPNWWTWNRRRNFVKQVWQMYEMGDDDVKTRIEQAMRRVRGWSTWKTKVRHGTPMGNIFKVHHFANDKAVELLRFVRLNLHHVKDTKEDGRTFKYILTNEDKVFEDPQHVEMVVTDTYPTFLVDLCSGLHKEGVTVRHT